MLDHRWKLQPSQGFGQGESGYGRLSELLFWASAMATGTANYSTLSEWDRAVERQPREFRPSPFQQGFDSFMDAEDVSSPTQAVRAALAATPICAFARRAFDFTPEDQRMASQPSGSSVSTQEYAWRRPSLIGLSGIGLQLGGLNKENNHE